MVGVIQSIYVKYLKFSPGRVFINSGNSENFPRKIPGKLLGKRKGFYSKTECYRAKSYLFMFVKKENSEKISGEVVSTLHKFRKFAKNFPEKFPEISRKTTGVF
jgi:hypothetical protein